jgi:hypothetical protein
MRVFGIDPGETTGIVAGNWVDGEFAFEAFERRFTTVSGEFQFYQSLLASASEVYCETFQLRTAVTSSNVLSPIIVRTIVQCAVPSWVVVGGYSASVTKSALTNDRLKRQGYWIAGKDHRRDALRQVLVSKQVKKGKG